MEALIVFLSELIVILVIAGVIFSLVGILTIVLGGFNLGVNRRKKSKKLKWLRRLSIIFVITFILVVALSLAINYLFFEPSARLVLEQVKNRTGIAMTFNSAQGNIFTGEVQLKGVKLIRDQDSSSRFQLQVEEIDLDMDMIELLSFRTKMEKLKITGLKGTFQRNAVVKQVRPRKAFEIRNFTIEDTHLLFSDTTRGANTITIPINIKKFHSSPFRSYMPIYDILFHSTGSGWLADDSDFAIYKEQSRDGKDIRWTFNDIPLETISAYATGSFNLISEGRVLLEIKNQFVPGVEPKVVLNCHLAVRDVKAQVPENYPETGIRHNLAQRLVNFINSHSRDISFRFSFQISQETFKYAVSLEGVEFWKLFRKELTSGMVRLTAKSKERIKDWGKKGLGKLKDYLEKKRKNKD